MTDKKCKDQVAENGACTTMYDCQNSLVCHASKCIKPYSLANGTEIKLEDIGTGPWACSTWAFTDKDGKFFCDEYTLQGSSWECADNVDQCTYKWAHTWKELKQDCQCAVSSVEKRFCPWDMSNAKFKVNKGSVYSGQVDSSAHTLRRLKVTTAAVTENTWNSYPNTETGVVVESCLKSALGSSSILKYSWLFLLWLFGMMM